MATICRLTLDKGPERISFGTQTALASQCTCPRVGLDGGVMLHKDGLWSFVQKQKYLKPKHNTIGAANVRLSYIILCRPTHPRTLCMLTAAVSRQYPACSQSEQWTQGESRQWDVSRWTALGRAFQAPACSASVTFKPNFVSSSLYSIASDEPILSVSCIFSEHVNTGDL